jgi:hypothetical protein
MDVSVNFLRDVSGAEARETRILFIELCGAFWVAAEMLILFFMLEARRHLGRNPVPAVPIWDRLATRRALFYFSFLAAVLAFVICRPFIWLPLHDVLRNGPLSVQTAAVYDFLAVQRHLAVWAAFVTLWVLLESTIVYQGYRCYQLLRSRLLCGPSEPAAPGPAHSHILTLLVICFLLTLGAFAGPAFAAPKVAYGSTEVVGDWSQVLALSESWLVPYRNAVYLYLRLAGILWIGVEWVAAVVLWRSHLLVSRALRANTGRP